MQRSAPTKGGWCAPCAEGAPESVMKVPRLALVPTLVLGLASLAIAAAPIGLLKQFKSPTANAQPRHIALGPDGNLWFTEGTDVVPAKIGRITPAGAITEFAIPTANC